MNPVSRRSDSRKRAGLTLLAVASFGACATTPRALAPPCPTASLAAVEASADYQPRMEDPEIRNRTAIVTAMEAEFKRRLSRGGAQAMNGTTEVWMLVDVDGRVAARAVRRSSGSTVVDEAALAVAEVYRIDPLVVNGCAVPSWVGLPLTFVTRMR